MISKKKSLDIQRILNTVIVIKADKEYEQALRRIYALMEALPGSPEENELERLAELVERYETEHFPIDPPDPAEAIRFRLEHEQPPDHSWAVTLPA